MDRSGDNRGDNGGDNSSDRGRDKLKSLGNKGISQEIICSWVETEAKKVSPNRSALAGEKTVVRLTCLVIKTGHVKMLGQIIA